MSLSITPELADQFARDGVVHLPSALSAEDLDRCLRAWQWSFDHPSPLASDLLPGCDHARQDLCHPNALSHYAPLVAESPLGDYARALWRSESVWFLYEQVFKKSAGLAGRTPWHQDTSYLAVGGDHLIAFWIPFEALPAQASLEFVRGSHRGTLYNTTRFDPNNETLPIAASDTVPNLPDIEADRGVWDIVSFAVTPGDVVAFHTSTLHGGGAVDMQTPERRTLTLRYFGENTRCELRPGQAGPFYADLFKSANSLQPGEPFRHPRFLQVRGSGTST